MPHTEIPSEERNISSGESSLSSNSSLQRLQEEFQQLAAPERDLRRNSNDSLRRIDGILPQYDNPNNDEEFYPAQAYLFPIVLPPRIEPTLEELLRNITCRNDLHEVDTLKLRVIALEISLYRLSSYMPNLHSLTLEGSVLNSLRDLGCGLVHLKYLNVSNCGLSSFDGTNGVSNLSTLIADKNIIQLVGPIQNLFLLRKLSIKDNRISDLGNVTFIGMCPMLQELDLIGNPVTKCKFYRSTLRQNLQSLKILDGLSFEDEDDTKLALIEANKKTEVSPTTSSASTLSDERFSELDTTENNSLASINLECNRPATSQGITVTEENLSGNNTGPERPGTATVVELRGKLSHRRPSLTSGQPLCGSLVGMVRERRTRKMSVTSRPVWGNVSSSSSSSLSSPHNSLNINMSKTLQKSFPMQLPQTIVSLEMGISGSPSSQYSLSGSSGSTEDIPSNSNLKKLASKWRNRCKQNLNEFKE